MKKLSESVWGEIRKKSLGQEARGENILEAVFIENKKMEFIDMSSSMYSGKKLWWSPCNFGATKPDEPGMWLDAKDLMELDELLKGTGYHIAVDWDWQHLVNCTCREVRLKDKKIYTMVLTMGANELRIPNFGYMYPNMKKPMGMTKGYSYMYGGVIYGKPSYMTLECTRSKCFKEIAYPGGLSEERMQVRLVRRESKEEYMERIKKES